MMDNLTSLLADIESGLCTKIARFKKRGFTHFIVLYKGLVFRLTFNVQGELLDCNADDKKVNFEAFVDSYGADYEFSHVLFEETHHLIYIKPMVIRPWMSASIAASSMPFYWCIARHFTQFNGPLPSYYKYLADNAVHVNHYLRQWDEDDSTYTKMSYDQLMKYTTPVDSVFLEATNLPC